MTKRMFILLPAFPYAFRLALEGSSRSMSRANTISITLRVHYISGAGKFSVSWDWDSCSGTREMWAWILMELLSCILGFRMNINTNSNEMEITNSICQFWDWRFATEMERYEYGFWSNSVAFVTWRTRRPNLTDQHKHKLWQDGENLTIMWVQCHLRLKVVP